MSAPHSTDWCASEEPPRRDIAALELVENTAPTAKNEIAQLVADAVGQAVEQLAPSEMGDATAEKVAKFRSAVMKATETAVGAIEGRLKGASLEGQLKEAQIVEAYAAVAEHNAMAAKAEEETAEIRERRAFARIKETIALYRELGIEVSPVALPDGRLGIVIGDQLAEVLPSLPSAESVGGLPPVS